MASQIPWLTYSLLFAVFLLALFLLLNQQRSSSRGKSLLLVGAPDAGKTAILTRLLYNQTLPTVTSLQTNSSVITLPSSKRIRIIDVPGHPRIRDQFREHLSGAKAVAFVVDSGTVSRNGGAVAEHLHMILHELASLPPSRSLPALLIIAHKTDLHKLTSSTTGENVVVARVKTVLERELEKRRASKLGGVGVEGLGEDGERSDMGGLECDAPPRSPFRFSDWEGGKVNFVGSSVAIRKGVEADGGENDQLSGFREWMEKCL